jgi:hypothetical protein
MSAAAPKTATVSTAPRGKGKAARRNAAKNAGHVLEYLEELESATKLVDLETYMESNSVQLARVTRQHGAGRLKVTLQDGSTDVDVTIAGSIRFKGRSSTKTDRSCCMCVNDLIVLHGPQAAGKIPRDLFGRIQTEFDRLGIRYPKGFFMKGGADTTAAAEEELGFEWEADEEDVAATLTAAAGKAKSKAKGGAGAAADGSDDDGFDIADI